MKTTNQILGAAMALLFGFGVLATEAAVNENFDTIFSTSYANQTGNGWRINSGLRSSSSRSGSCARLASAGSANYLQYEGADGNGKDGGVGTISFWYRGWDNNPQEKFKVQVDINGAGFTDISSEISPTLTYTEFTYDLNNASDNIIVRIQQTAGERILIDDASIGDYSGGSTPTITLSSGDLSAFSTTYGIASAAQSFTVAGSDLTANITVTAPSGYNVSLSSGSGYGSSVSLTPSGGTVSETTVYVRLTGAATGAFSGNVSATSTDAAEKTKAVSGTVGLAAPTGVVASETNATDFTASWSAVSGASGYRLDVSEYEEFCTTGGTPENLMSNAGFETGDGTDWDKFETEYSVVTTDPQEGTYHVAVTATATRDLTQNVSITGDGVTEYEISY